MPFYLRTGKRSPTKCSEVVVYFKNPPPTFSDSYQQLPQNKLTIRLQPDEGIEIQVLNKVPGLDHKHRLQTTKLDLGFSETFNEDVADAYERLRGRPCAAFRRCSCAAMKWKKWKWVDSSWTHGKPTTGAEALSGGHTGAGGLGGDDLPDGRSRNEFE